MPTSLTFWRRIYEDAGAKERKSPWYPIAKRLG
jgi:hypothetical protein